MPTELNVKLALEDVWMNDGVILLVMKDAAKMKVIETKTNKKISVVASDDT